MIMMSHNTKMRAWMDKILERLFDSGFNFSISKPQTSYAYCASRIAGISPMLKWQENSIKDPDFGLKTQWIPNGLTVKTAAEDLLRKFDCSSQDYRPIGRINSSTALAKVVFDYKNGKFCKIEY